jgi:hypothetical protein
MLRLVNLDPTLHEKRTRHKLCILLEVVSGFYVARQAVQASGLFLL